ncbi:MAG: phosphotransferase [Acidobacteriota bacterium]|nr:phosphotransferase [Acidobacteriota bacterium]
MINAENLRAYLHSCSLISAREAVIVHELGGGVSNTVLMAERASDPGVRWVAKQSLGKLRVKDEWLSDRARIFREAEALQLLRPLLGNSALPEIVYVDHEAFLFIMTAAPADSRTWKEMLMEGSVSLAVARQAGELLATLIQASSLNPQLEERFRDQTVFEELRIDPYYRTAAARHPDLAPALDELIADSSAIRRSIVHGDFSPKNMLVSEGNIFLIDFEVVHWGDPAFDAGFLLSHLFLKAFHQPRFSARYAEAANAFWLALNAGQQRELDFEPRTLRHLGALLLARIDGKSPVEYIRDEDVKNEVRNAARRLLVEQPQKLHQALGAVLA